MRNQLILKNHYRPPHSGNARTFAGKSYPQHLQLLFICSRNQWRSPTAEAIFNKYPHVARSAGTAPSARIRAGEKLIAWADIIFVMEKKHRRQLQEKFAPALEGKPVIVLDIPDDYGFMDEELIRILEDAVPPYLPE